MPNCGLFPPAPPAACWFSDASKSAPPPPAADAPIDDLEGTGYGVGQLGGGAGDGASRHGGGDGDYELGGAMQAGARLTHPADTKDLSAYGHGRGGSAGGVRKVKGNDMGAAHWNWGQQSKRGVESDRRAWAVSQGAAVVPSPRKAGPSTNWRKFSKFQTQG